MLLFVQTLFDATTQLALSPYAVGYQDAIYHPFCELHRDSLLFMVLIGY